MKVKPISAPFTLNRRFAPSCVASYHFITMPAEAVAEWRHLTHWLCTPFSVLLSKSVTSYSALVEMCRVRKTHHCEPKINGFLFQTTPFWCAERTLQNWLIISESA